MKKYLVCFMLISIFLFSISCGKIVITYANWQFLEPGRGDTLREFIRQFQKENPDILVRELAIPYTSYNDALTNQFAAGAGPDIFFVQDYVIIPWIQAGFLEPIDNLIDINKYKADFPPQQDVVKFKGKYYAILYEGFPYGALFYNKKIFEEAGLERPPYTPEELLEYSEIIKEKTGKIGLIHPTDFSKPGYILQGGLIVIFGFGGKIMENGEFTVNQREFVKGVEFLKKIYDLPSHPAGTDFGLQRQNFLQGNAAMVLDGNYWGGVVKLANPELYENLGVAELPFVSKVSPFETNWYAINAHSSPEKKKAAAKFLEFLLRKDIASKWAVDSVIPGLKYTYEPIRKAYPWFEVFEKAAPFGRVRPLPGYEVETPEIMLAVADYIVKAMAGEMTPQEAMDALKAYLDKNFKK